MAYSTHHPAALDESKLECLQGLETKLGKVLVALEPAPVAELSATELAQVREAEEQLGVVLVAYEGG